MEKPSFEERIQKSIERISIAINGLNGTIDRLYQDWKFPVKTMAEHMQPDWDRQEAENRFNQEITLLKKQNKILIFTVIISTVSVILTALISLIDIYLRLK